MKPRPRSIDHWQLADTLLRAHPLLRVRVEMALKAAGHCPSPSEPSGTLANRSLTELLRFLHLCAFDPRPLTPSELVDRCWHELILFTKLYQETCRVAFGRFVHHNPSADPFGGSALRRTLSLYRHYYGEPSSDLWGITRHEALCDEAPCGACDSA